MSDINAAIQIVEHNITNKSDELTKGREELKAIYNKLVTITRNLNQIIADFDSGWEKDDAQ